MSRKEEDLTLGKATKQTQMQSSHQKKKKTYDEMDGGQHLYPTSVATVTRQHSRSADGRRHLESNTLTSPSLATAAPATTLMDMQSNHLHIPHALRYKRGI